MASQELMMIAVDDSEASRKAVGYVADVLGPAEGFEIELFHVLPPIPPAMLEHGGLLRREAKRELQRKMDAAIERWTEERKEEARETLSAMQNILQSAGVAPERITFDFVAPLPEQTIGPHILAAAREKSAHTVVVGRAPRKWWSEVFHRHPTGSLLSMKARGFTVWVVE